MTLRVVALASGRGSNLKAILEAADAGQCSVRIEAVITDRRDAGVLEIARQRGIPADAIPLARGTNRDAWNEALRESLQSYAPDLVVSVGFMRVLGSPVLGRFPNRIVNIHPSLLPAFPGVRAWAQALEAGVRIAGCTVHVVDEGVDTGPILAQAAVPVFQEDDAERLHARIQGAEHALLPRVLHAIAEGSLTLSPTPRWEPMSVDTAPLFAPQLP